MRLFNKQNEVRGNKCRLFILFHSNARHTCRATEKNLGIGMFVSKMAERKRISIAEDWETMGGKALPLPYIHPPPLPPNVAETDVGPLHTHREGL